MLHCKPMKTNETHYKPLQWPFGEFAFFTDTGLHNRSKTMQYVTDYSGGDNFQECRFGTAPLLTHFFSFGMATIMSFGTASATAPELSQFHLVQVGVNKTLKLGIGWPCILSTPWLLLTLHHPIVSPCISWESFEWSRLCTPTIQLSPAAVEKVP